MKPLFINLLLFITITGLAQNAKLKGEIYAPTGESVFLKYLNEEERKLVTLDSVQLEEGKFELSVQLDSTMLLFFGDGNEMTQLLMQPGDDMNMTLHTSFFDETLHYTGKGSEKNQLIKSLSLSKEAVDIQISNRVYGTEEMDTTVLFPLIDEQYGKLSEMISAYANENPDISEFLLARKDEAESTAGRYKNRIKQSIVFDKLVVELKGEQVMNFAGNDLEGNSVSIHNFKGKPVLIDFWATWCGPCKREMPALQTIEKEYGEKVNIISVGVWCKEDEWKEMAVDYGFQHNMFIPRGDDKDLRKDYMLNSIPRYILLDKDLKIVDLDASRPSSGELEADLDVLLK